MHMHNQTRPKMQPAPYLLKRWSNCSQAAK